MTEDVKKILKLFERMRVLSILESKDRYIVSVCGKNADLNSVTESLYTVDKNTYKIAEFSYFDNRKEYAEACEKIVYTLPVKTTDEGSEKFKMDNENSIVVHGELYHWGIKGMRWGHRRYQNPDGSLTPAGRKRYTNSDGTLNEKGEKYIAKETERLKTERTRIENQKKVDARLAKLDKMRKSNDDLRKPEQSEDEAEAKKKPAVDRDSKPESPKTFDMDSLTNDQLDKMKARMDKEDNLKISLEKRGYIVSTPDNKSEMDRRIEQLTKQKQILELERDVAKTAKGKSAVDQKIEALQQQKTVLQLEKDIRGLTPEKKSKLAKFYESPVGKAITDKAINTGSDIIKELITGKKGNPQQPHQQQQGKPNANPNQNPNQNQNKPAQNQNGGNKPAPTFDDLGANELGKQLGKVTGRVAEAVNAGIEKENRRKEKAAQKEAKREARAAEREAKQQAKELAKAIKAERKAEERAAERAYSNEVSSKVVDYVANKVNYIKTAPSDYYNKAYETKVENLLAEMDAKAWEFYNATRTDDD